MEESAPDLNPAADCTVLSNSSSLWEAMPSAPSMQLGVLSNAQSRLKDLMGMFFMVTLSFLALLANTPVMVVIVRAPHLRKFAFVGHLCALDLLCAALLMPLGIVTTSPYFGTVTFTVLECQVYIFLNVFLICSSVLTITAISIERYYYIVHPMRYEVKMTLKLAVAVMVFIWAKSILLALVTLFRWPAYGNKSSISATHCSLHWSHSDYRRVFSIVFTAVCFCLPALVIFIVYSRIYRVARTAACRRGPLPAWASTPKRRSDSINSQTTIITTTRNAPHRQPPERTFGGAKAAFTLVVIVGQFVICWLPYFTFHLHLSLNSSLRSPQDVEGIVTWLGYSSFTTNPFLYGLLNQQIREELCKLCRCCGAQTVEPAASSLEGSAQENFLQFLQRSGSMTETWSGCLHSSPRNTPDQTAPGLRIPGQIPEEFC